MQYNKLKSVLLAFVLAFFRPLGLFYAGVGWGVLAMLITFMFSMIGSGVRSRNI